MYACDISSNVARDWIPFTGCQGMANRFYQVLENAQMDGTGGYVNDTLIVNHITYID